MTQESSVRRIVDPAFGNYHIELDTFCYILVETVTAEESGRTRTNIVGYYTSLEICLQRLVEQTVNKAAYNSIKEYVDAFTKMLATVRNIKIGS